MASQAEKAQQFRQHHVAGNPIILFNVWDAGSAKVVAGAGAKAIATGSWSVAAAHGFKDGERLPFEAALANLTRISASVDLPVTVDLESGYGEAPARVGDTISRSLEAGAIGCNLEDSYADDGSLRSIEDQSARIAAARKHADATGISYFINARTDMFFQAPASAHDRAMVAAALERAHAYAQAGADGLFVPGLVKLSLVEELTAMSPLPVNLMIVSESPAAASLAKAGVARLSYGPAPFAKAMQALEAEAQKVFGG